MGPTNDECTPVEPNILTSKELDAKIRANGSDTWLWCICCTRFFQERHVRVDGQGSRERCAFCGCAGFGVAIFPWRTFRTRRWPKHERDLRVGAKSPD